MESLDIKRIRSQFPALTQSINGYPAIFLMDLVELKYRVRCCME
jgi:hypothetical protein